MANARSQFDSIAGVLAREHEVQVGLLYGKPSLALNNQTFAAYIPEAMAFRLHGRGLADALKVPDAKGWDPLRDDRAAPGWVLIPATQAMRWDGIARDAMQCAREASEGPVSYAVPPPPPPAAEEPPPSTPENLAQRAANAASKGFGSLTLSDAVPITRKPFDAETE